MINIEELSILEARRHMDNGTLTSLQLTKMYLERIAKYDKNGPRLNSVLEINPDALHIAEAMDYELMYMGKRSLIHGIPVLLKDNISTGDKMHTSAGSMALAHLYSAEDSFLVKNSREAGAVILGKTNMTEFANFFAENMPPGYSSRGGQVISPYDTSKTPSGSSSGSAVAVAANLCSVAVGTETNGSIISPAKANCVVGIKPTVGLISRNGIIPISISQDTAGPIARTVADATILLGVMTGVDEKDPATWKSKWLAHQDYTSFLSLEKVCGLRVGFYKIDADKFNSEDKALISEAIGVLSKYGVEIVEIEQEDYRVEFMGSSVCLHEFKSGINYYLSKIDDGLKTRCLADIITYNNEHPETCMKYGQKILELSQETSGTLTEEKFLQDRLKDIRDMRVNGIDKMVDELKLDAVLFYGQTSIAAISGYPCIMVPAGLSKTSDWQGFSFVGKAFYEPILISLAYTYEHETKKRKPPELNFHGTVF
ncbi:amidase family protein [Gorillibacterium massiliense]|uniref:amidase family protein n=1 Tax=Gorillibacterium massiliense TaxID=1280390 RepID=UPI0005941D77|nr:amidase family protein [Gorillibacterium massiliense]